MKASKPLLIIMFFSLFACQKDAYNLKDSEQNLKNMELEALLDIMPANSLLNVVSSTTSKTIKIPNNNNGSGCNGAIFGITPRTINGISVRSSHGRSIQFSSILGMVSLGGDFVGGQALGAGIVMSYPFKRGYSYKIDVTGFSTSRFKNGDAGIAGQGIELQTQLTNDPNISTTCSTNPTEAAVDFETMTLPWKKVPHFQPQRTQPPSETITLSTKSVTFDPVMECYSYLWLNTVPTVPSSPDFAAVIIEKIVIHETKLLDISGDDAICENSIETYTATMNSFPLAGAFEWYVDGNLQIVGSNVGGSVQVQATGPNGGNISYSPGGTCSNIITKAVVSENPIIIPDHYVILPGGTQLPLKEYISVANNPVYPTPSTAQAIINISGSVSNNVNLIYYDQNYSFPYWSGSIGNDKVMISVDMMEDGQIAIFRVTANSSCGVTTFDVAFHGGQY